jgi:hypothetical protein
MQHASGDTRMRIKISGEIPEAKRLIGRYRRRRTILKLIFAEQGIQVRIEVISLKTAFSDEFLLTQHWTLGFPKRQRIHRLAEQQLAHMTVHYSAS